jgi:hypothetical protein
MAKKIGRNRRTELSRFFYQMKRIRGSDETGGKEKKIKKTRRLLIHHQLGKSKNPVSNRSYVEAVVFNSYAD